MKILYSAGNRTGAGLQLTRFLRDTEHEVKVAAYLKSSQTLPHIDWTIEGANHKFSSRRVSDLHDVFGVGKFPHICVESAEILLADVHEYAPDLIICDGEHIMADVAHALDIKLWFVSPLHLLNGIKWKKGQLKYDSLLDSHRRMLHRLPPANKTFICSPFCNVEGVEIKDGFEWIKPYYHDIELKDPKNNVAIVKDIERVSELSKILNCVPPFDLTLFSKFSYDLSKLNCINIKKVEEYKNLLSECRWLFTTGESSYIADALYAGIPNICISPGLDDPEALLNAILCEWYNAGDNIGQIEKMGRYAIDEIEKSIFRERAFSMNNDYVPTLNERINECLSV